jgi:hypothetical protein
MWKKQKQKYIIFFKKRYQIWKVETLSLTAYLAKVLTILINFW